MLSPAIQNLIALFSKFPGIGPKTAERFVFYLSSQNKAQAKELITAIVELKNKVKNCSLCSKTFEGQTEFCEICSNPSRDKSIICIVEKETDLEAIEKTSQFKGIYFILGGVLTDRQKEKIEQKVAELIEKIRKIASAPAGFVAVKEIILALNPTPEGRTTSLFLKRKIAPLQIKTTLLGVGLPLGSELEYADEETLSLALDNRK